MTMSRISIPGGGSGGGGSVTDSAMAGALGPTTAAAIAGRAELKAAFVALGKVAQAARDVPGFSGPNQPGGGVPTIAPHLSAQASAPATTTPVVRSLGLAPSSVIQGPLMADPAMFYGSVAHSVDASGRIGSFQPHGTTGPEASMEWVTDSPLFALIGTFGLTGFRLWANGELVYSLATGSPFNNGFGYIDWSGVRQMRHYRLLAGNGLAVSGFACDAADTFYAPTHRRQVKLGWLGDSYSQGNVSLPYQVGRLLGWTMPLVSADGGTGYITTGSGQPFTSRTADIVAANPDVVVVAGGINDPLTGLQAGATTVLQSIRAGLPNAPIFVVGPWCPPGSPYSVQATKYAAIQAAAAATSGCTFIDPHTWWTGTGNSGSRVVTDGVLNSTTTITSATAAFVAGDVGSYITGTGIPAGAKITSVTNTTTAVLSAAATATATGVSITVTNQKGDGNSDIYINSDNTHPNPLGYNYLAGRLASAILATLPY